MTFSYESDEISLVIIYMLAQVPPTWDYDGNLSCSHCFYKAGGAAVGNHHVSIFHKCLHRFKRHNFFMLAAHRFVS